MCFHTFQPVTDQLEIINGLKGNPDIMCASSSDEGLSGVDSEESVYDTEEFYLDFDLESTQMGIDAESLLLDNEMHDEDTEALSEPFEVNYKDYNMLPICVEQADEVALTLDKLIKRGKIPKNGIFYKYLKGVLLKVYNPFRIFMGS